MRTFLFRLIYGKEEYVKNIIIADLDSEDKTVENLSKLQLEYDCIKLVNWKTCKEIIDDVNKN